MTKVFIDGKEGTTGLKIFDRLAKYEDIEIISIPEEKRKDVQARKECINNSDITFLCLPDWASIEAVTLVENPNTKIIDASTAHRTNPQWAYGFPELGKEFRQNIATSKRVANPGCHASGFISIVYPLVKCGLLDKNADIVSFSLTGYSGGGKKMIAEYEGDNRSEFLSSPRQYGLGQMHKHLKEMKYVCGLNKEPLFSPIVADYYRGMQTSVPVFSHMVKGYTAKQIREFFAEYYKDSKMVNVMSFMGETEGFNNFLPSNIFADKNNLSIFVGGCDDRILIAANFDNLGKGASGSAVQCMNVMLGKDETYSLI